MNGSPRYLRRTTTLFSVFHRLACRPRAADSSVADGTATAGPVSCKPSSVRFLAALAGLLILSLPVIGRAAADAAALATEVPSSATRLTPSIAFGFPDLFAARLSTAVAVEWDVGAALGVLPATLVVDPLSGLGPQAVSPDYTIELAPTFVVWAPQFFARWNPGGWRGAVTASVGALIARAGARGTLHHRVSGSRATLAETTTTLTQPLLSLAVEYPLASGDGWQLRGTLGVLWLFATSLRGSATGLLPAFLATNPEALDSFDDALVTAERELSDTLRRWNGRPPFLPTVSVALQWK